VFTNNSTDCHSGNGCVVFADQFDVIGEQYTFTQTVTGITPGSFLDANFWLKETSLDPFAIWSVTMTLDNSFTVVQGTSTDNRGWTQEGTTSGLYQALGSSVTVTITLKNSDEFDPASVLIDDVFVAVACNPSLP
jgi:hypothetical protein